MAGSLKPIKPSPMIRITLSLVQQNKLLPVLSKVLNIHETWPQPHVILMRPHLFGEFIAECALLEDAPTIKQMNVERTDLHKEPKRTIVKYKGHPYDEINTITRTSS